MLAEHYWDLGVHDLVDCVHSNVTDQHTRVIAEVSLHVQVPVHVVAAGRIWLLVADRGGVVYAAEVK